MIPPRPNGRSRRPLFRPYQPVTRSLGGSGQGGNWVLSPDGVQAGVDLFFTAGQYFGNTLANVACSRASNATYFDQSGNLQTASSNVLRQTYDPVTNRALGLWIEEARTNNALWCRDMTQAAWVAVNITPALTATGITGAANSASTLTSTLGNGTILQTITLGSAADTYSVWLKRVSGSGTINIAADGATWTAAAVTTTWTKFQVQQTLANPVFGIQIVTSGDVIAADFNQLETGAMDSSPILTTTVAVTRAADVVTLSSPPTFGAAYTMFAQAIFHAPTSYGTVQTAGNIGDGTTSNRADLRRNGGDGLFKQLIVTGGSSTLGTGGVITADAVAKLIAAFAASDDAASINGASVFTASSAQPIGPAAVALGGSTGSNQSLNGYLQRIAIWPTTRISNAGLQAVTL